MTASRAIVLANDILRVEIDPDLGGSVLRLDNIAVGQCIPILRPWGGSRSATDRAMFVMLPWCNRVSGGGFIHDSHFHPIAPNLPEQVMPIHGTGFALNWRVMQADDRRLVLACADYSVSPFDFEAMLEYYLEGSVFTARLTLVHRGVSPAPYGLGFHPWFAWTVGDRLSFNAAAFAHEDVQRLPTGIMHIAPDDHQGYAAPRALPVELVNQTYLDWDGHAQIARANGDRVLISAIGAARHLHLFSRGDDCGFVCLEPVSHTTDALNRPLHATALPVVLQPGAEMTAEIAISLG